VGVTTYSRSHYTLHITPSLLTAHPSSARQWENTVSRISVRFIIGTQPKGNARVFRDTVFCHWWANIVKHTFSQTWNCVTRFNSWNMFSCLDTAITLEISNELLHRYWLLYYPYAHLTHQDKRISATAFHYTFCFYSRRQWNEKGLRWMEVLFFFLKKTIFILYNKSAL